MNFSKHTYFYYETRDGMASSQVPDSQIRKEHRDSFYNTLKFESFTFQAAIQPSTIDMAK